MTKFNPRVLDRIRYEQDLKNDKELAEHLGVSRTSIHRWRSGAGTPSFEVLSRIVLKDGIPYEAMAIPVTEAVA